jgi:hypothetical protein
MTFIKVLGPILARGSNPIIVRRDLKGRGPSASDYPRQVSQQFDRDRVASVGHAQYIWQELSLRKGSGITSGLRLLFSSARRVHGATMWTLVHNVVISSPDIQISTRLMDLD